MEIRLNAYAAVVIFAVLIIAIIAMIKFRLELKKLRNIYSFRMKKVPLNDQELEMHVKNLADEHSNFMTNNIPNWPIPRLDDNYNFIHSVYRDLSSDIQLNEQFAPVSEWLLDNFYFIEELVKELQRNLSKKTFSKLPDLRGGDFKNYPRIFALIMELVTHTDGKINEENLLNYMKVYQGENVLYDREIWAIPVVMKIALIENIRHICEDIQETQNQRHRAEEIFDKWLTGDDMSEIRNLVRTNIKEFDETSFLFIEHLLYHLRKSGKNYTEFLNVIEETLEDQGTTIEKSIRKEHELQSSNTVSIGNYITSLKYFSTLEWSTIFEEISFVGKILKEDPAEIYSLMDIATRNYYKGKVEELADIYGVSEIHVAKEAIELTKNAYSESKESDAECSGFQRTHHVGYYLIGKGTEILGEKLGGSRSIIPKIKKMIKKNLGVLYFGSISLLLVTFIAVAVRYAISNASQNAALIAVIAGFAVLIPSSEIAFCAANHIFGSRLGPSFFPKLELKEGIPEDMGTIIVMPAILPDGKRVEELLGNLERHYLLNKENNLYFALLGCFKDGDSPVEEDDSKIIEKAINGIKELNTKYSDPITERFYFFHRKRQFSKENNQWIGWERKRGALLEFNDMILGSNGTSIVYASPPFPTFKNIKYVITLDSDTILPMDAAKKMIGIMAHPLNRPSIDKEKGIVTEGYGILQPKVDIEMESTNATFFSRIFTGQKYADPYAEAEFDIYQDIFGEGIFTGKGIYDLKVFQTLLKDTFPENTILSHDLLEGSYLRAALVSDVRLVDSFPATYNAFVKRGYRWVRGDWQLLPFIFGKNHLSALSRWKMLDNLRRSLVAPSLIALLILALTILPGSKMFWIGFYMLTLAVYLISNALGSTTRYVKSKRHSQRIRTKKYLPTIGGVKATFYQAILKLIFLPYQSYLIIRAVLVTLSRVFITKKNLLEWVTSAAEERKKNNSLKSYVLEMQSSIWIGLAVFLLALYFKSEAIVLSFIFFALSLSAPYIAYRISQKEAEKPSTLTKEELCEISRIARKTWRYFEEFANAENNYLAPDNFQEDSPNGIARRTSPTNISLGLMAVLTARDFGYIGTKEMKGKVSNTITAIEKMEKWNGHLYNWYDTKTLQPLLPRYISTADSGNLVGYLITLSEGLKGYLKKPITDLQFINGIRDTLYNAGEEGMKIYQALGFEQMQAMDMFSWNRIVRELSTSGKFAGITNLSWRSKIEEMLVTFNNERLQFMPAIDLIEKLPESLSAGCFSHYKDDFEEIAALLKNNPILEDLPGAYARAEGIIGKIMLGITQPETESLDDLIFLSELHQSFAASFEAVGRFLMDYEELIHRVDSLSETTKFLPLYDEKKQLFSIGFDLEVGELTDSYYDLLASEARQASYISIARDEIPPEHWLKLSRSLTVDDGYKGLASWSGTMFEYLMPVLIMKSYKNTMLDETYHFVIRSQKKYGKQNDIPWGISESGFNDTDVNLSYQYKAFGVPWLGLKRGLMEDTVVSPYSTFLALQIDAESAVQNIAYLKEEGLEGAYGFYEAADYTPERLLIDDKRSIIKEFMSHHQGMSFMAMNNFLHDFIMQKRFFEDPAMYASRFLLQEQIPSAVYNFNLKAKTVKIKIDKNKGYKDSRHIRTFNLADPVLPKVHLLSNGNYSVMITDRGTGYSRCNDKAITRWREENVADRYGMFFYIKNVSTNKIWSSAYAPLSQIPEKYEVIYTNDKAVFKRTDGDINTQTEVIVVPKENVEIRKMTLGNAGDSTCDIEVTSYFESVMTTQNEDIAHPAFHKLFMKTEILKDKNGIIASNRPKSASDNKLWTANFAVVEGETIGDSQFETDRMQFIGRNRDLGTPAAMDDDQPLSGTEGTVLDPVMSMRLKGRMLPGKSLQISYITAVSESMEDLSLVIEKYSQNDFIDRAFTLAHTSGYLEAAYLDIEPSQMELYQNMTSSILYSSPSRRKFQKLIERNALGQSSLWRFGISGDDPIVLLVLKNIDEIRMLDQILKAHDYWMFKKLTVDLVILCEEVNSYDLPLHASIIEALNSSHIHQMIGKSGGAFIVDKSKTSLEEIYLLYAVARIIVRGDGGTLSEQMEETSEREPEQQRDSVYSKAIREYGSPASEEPTLLYPNGLGGFTEDGREYVIQMEKDKTTPAPWINVISNPNFGFIVSESGAGYTWYGNSRENKLSTWSNDPVTDEPGEVLYIRDDDTGESWTVTSSPVRENEAYEIRHGFGYTEFRHVSHGIEQRLVQFVPVNETIKISILKLSNLSNEQRNLSLTYYVRPVLGVTDQVTAMHIKTNLNAAGVLLVENPYNEEYKAGVCFMDLSLESRSVTGNRKEFIGSGNLANPECLRKEKLTGAVGTGFDPCAAMQVNISLKPMEEKDIVLTFGAAEKTDEVDQLTNKYRNVQESYQALTAVKEFWKEKLEGIQVTTPDISMNLMLNGWLQYQIISCRLWARSAFYQSSGAYGFRDQLQDALAAVHISPEIARKQILLHAEHQFVEGDVQHWWHDPSGKGVRTRFSDDLLWLPYVTMEYASITGDKGILKSELSYLESPLLEDGEEEKYGIPSISNSSATLFAHCIAAVEKTLKFGNHGLPLMGSGDWNDSMNTVGNKGSGESVWLGWFLIAVLKKIIPVCTEMGASELSKKYATIINQITESIEKFAWDGKWYIRAYFDNGIPLGSIENSECKIDSIAQTWSIISEAGNPERARQAMNSVEDYLITREDGVIKLLTPPFDTSEMEPGYIKGYGPGVRENGGQYTHAAAWVIIAFAKLGDGDKAYELYELINPINNSRNQRECFTYKVEPYVMAADVYAVPPHSGQGGWTWYTGSAGWMYKAGLEYILGFQKHGATLLLDPCIPQKWPEYTIRYKYFDSIYNIKVKNPEGVNKGVKTIGEGRETREGNVLELVNDGKVHDIEVLMGK
ncbi:glycosyl hydrolase 94 [Trichococcus palustris]|uniref:Glycosyl hydrolase 94 n=1 Tax=Trichococcus palustris TaxID=140314 RepID=A0A143YAT7_9LACT|nr:glucoamylase family protein [Trichococcus palustris]CZQ86184.1 glycosyl hydrolase 94 [Trichococcus palustris]SFK58029.1 Cellobiose phosphorylase [Trichococcus palustris]